MKTKPTRHPYHQRRRRMTRAIQAHTAPTRTATTTPPHEFLVLAFYPGATELTTPAPYPTAV